MAISSRKLTTYAKDVSTLSDRPNADGVTAEQLKAILIGPPKEEIKTMHNGLIDDLLSTTDGNSGADNLGSTALKTGGATTVQGQLEELKAEKIETSNIINAITVASRTDKVISEKAFNDKQIEIGAADMTKFTYDPTSKQTDAFNAANHAYDHTISGLTSSTTKLAIDEVVNLISAITTRVSTAETDIDTLQTTAWQNLGSISVSSNTLRLDINVPTGINEVRITGMLKVGTSSVTTCQFNDDSTSNYYYAHGNLGSTYSGSSNTSTSLIVQPISTTDTNIDMHFFHLADTGLYKKVESFTNSNGASANISLGIKASTTAVTKITLINSNNIVSGTNLRVWGR